MSTPQIIVKVTIYESYIKFVKVLSQPTELFSAYSTSRHKEIQPRRTGHHSSVLTISYSRSPAVRGICCPQWQYLPQFCIAKSSHEIGNSFSGNQVL